MEQKSDEQIVISKKGIDMLDINKNDRTKKIKKITISLFCIIVGFFLIIMPATTVIIYESIFGIRYETSAKLELKVEDYADLQVETSNFQSDDVQLAGYKYSKTHENIKGVVVFAHGMGDGGHNSYMPFIDYLATNGYYVFAYDARGTDNSGGEDVEGFPQGIIDLDNAINYVESIDEYKNLPVVLFGYSWGAYSVGNVLQLHPEVKAAAMIAGFNESEDMLLHYAQKYAGEFVEWFLPYVSLYENIKFGDKYTSCSTVSGIAATDAGIMIAHGKADESVPIECGYEIYYEEYKDLERVEFVLYEDKGHMDILYSDSTQVLEPNQILMDQIIEMYDKYC